MKLEDRLGELLIVGFEGQEMNTALAAHIRNLRPAGLIFFKRNIVSPEQVAQLTRDIQSVALSELGRPLLLAVDQEGGTVARMPPPFAQLPDAASLGASGCDAVRHYSGLTAREMFQVGLNLNLAPVLDVNSDSSAGLMRYRSFGEDPSLVAQCGVAAITATQNEGIMATAKHFPGLGRAQTDPHHDLPVVASSNVDLHRQDLFPFQAAIRTGVACVMSSHTQYPALDPEHMGTFSPAILQGLLRDKLGFGGVIITDDLEMGAVDRQYTTEGAALAALEAGADLLLVCNDLEKMSATARALHHGLGRSLLNSQNLARSMARTQRLREAYLTPLKLADADAVAAYFSA